MMDYRLLIGGELVAGDDVVDVVNPATGAPFAVAPRASAEQAIAAVAAAKAAAPSWGASPVETRRAALTSLADALDAESEAFARLLTMEQGKPLGEARGEVAFASASLRYHATLALPGRMIQDDAHARIRVDYRPLGVVVGITAWNFPLALACAKLAPALLAGNSLILKPAPTTPLVALSLAVHCQAIFPAGVVNVITDANDLGPILTSHPDVAKIGFTGSTATGRAILASAATGPKRATLELGGNDPAIVLDDADIGATAQAIFAYAFFNCGQACLAIKRVYVPTALYEAMCSELVRLARAARVGDGLDPATQIGPLQNLAQFEKIAHYVDAARQAGTLVAGGERVTTAGFFITPAIVRDAVDGDPLVDEEQFGPILPLIPYSDLEGLVDRLNAGPFGLGASVWGRDVTRAEAIAERIESGQVWVNQHIAIAPHIPMAGFRTSGLGVEQSEEGLAEYMQIRVLNSLRGAPGEAADTEAPLVAPR